MINIPVQVYFCHILISVKNLRDVFSCHISHDLNSRCFINITYFFLHFLMRALLLTYHKPWCPEVKFLHRDEHERRQVVRVLTMASGVLCVKPITATENTKYFHIFWKVLV